MSQHINLEVAMGLKRGDILYHNILEFGGIDEDKVPATCRVAGKVRVLPEHNVERFVLPVVRGYGDMARTTITWMSRDLWRTTPEREQVRRIVRSRHTATYSTIQEPPAADPEVAPARVRRTRRA